MEKKYYSVLVVDDEPLALEGMRLMINWRACGFELAGEASCAQEASRMLRARRYDLLITDVCMPDMDGMELAAYCQQHDPRMKLLFFSGHRNFHYAQKAISTGVMDYLLKPIDPDEVEDALRKIAAALDAQSPPDAAPTVLRTIHALRRLAFGDHSSDTMARVTQALRLTPNLHCRCAIILTEDRSALDLQPHVQQLASVCTTACRLASCYTALFLTHENDGCLQTLAHTLRELTGLPLRISVGGMGQGAEGFAASLREALEAAESRYEADGLLNRFQPFTDDTARWLIHLGQMDLIRAIEQGDLPALETLLQKLCDASVQENPPHHALRFIFLQSEIALYALGQNRSRQIGPSRPLARFWRAAPQDMPAWIREYAGVLMQLVSGICGESGHTCLPEPVRQTLSRIARDYRQPLSISGIAGELYMNTAYLGQLIRTATGHTFSHHLLHTRMRHACRLLRQTRMTIQEIAAEVGFRDVNYFSQQFSKLYGMSPNAYRGAIRTEGADSL